LVPPIWAACYCLSSMAHFGPNNYFGESTLGPKAFGFCAPPSLIIQANFHPDRNRAPTGIGALPSVQSLVANLSDAILLERRKPRGVDRGFPRTGLGSAEQRKPIREMQTRTETESWMWDLPLSGSSLRLSR
jgi:hypothetical protein